MTVETTSREFFERKYAEDEDPWHFASSEYELDRYAATVRLLRGRRYKRAFEPGCSIGVLTASLAPLCDELLAMDISESAVAQAKQRCRAYQHVTIASGSFPEALPAGKFDLIVLSEIGYYFSEHQLLQLTEQLVARVEAGGVVVGVHWLGISPDHVLTGDRVHDILRANTSLKLEQAERHTGFRLDRWSRL